jgi:general secretion pathway protein G
MVDVMQKKAGFTLIELMAVMMIIGVLAGLIVGLSQYARRKSAESAARTEIAFIEDAVQRYRLQTGYYPSPTNSSRGLLVLTNGYLTWRPSRIATNGLKDPFHGIYQYCYPGRTNIASFDVWTMSYNKQIIGNFGR